MKKNNWIFWVIGGSLILMGSTLYYNYTYATSLACNQQGIFGDMFGASNAIFSGLSFLGVVIAILLQRQDSNSSKYSLLYEQMLNFTYVQLDRYDKALNNLKITNREEILSDNAALYFLYSNLKPISLAFADTPDDRKKLALNMKEDILSNLNFMVKSRNDLVTFLLSTDNCFLTLNEYLNKSKLTDNDKVELRNIFKKNLGKTFDSTVQTLISTIYLYRMNRFELNFNNEDFFSLTNVLTQVSYFHIFLNNKQFYKES